MKIWILVAMGGALSFITGCGADAGTGTGSELVSDEGNVKSTAQPLPHSAEGFFGIENGYVIAVYNPSDARFGSHFYYCHVYDPGELGALSITYGFSGIGSSSKAELDSLAQSYGWGGSTDTPCAWPNGMIGRADFDGQRGVYLITGATYQSFGFMCWLKNNDQVSHHGGWGAVWSDPSILTGAKAHLELLTSYSPCGANNPNSCHQFISACSW